MSEDATAPSGPEEAYAAFLVLRETGSDVDFEAWVLEQHPQWAADLRQLHDDQAQLAGLLDLHSTAGRAVGGFFVAGAGTRLGAEHDPAPLQPGMRIDEFELVRRLGHGGMGQVWEARQPSLKRRVALKLLKEERSLRERDQRRFEQEATAAARINHENVVRVYAAGQHDGRHWIAQELVEGGGTLHTYLDAQRASDEPLPDLYYTGVARLFLEIADGLCAAHGAGVTHRDLKPQNILITREGRPKVTDFGLARLDDQETFTQTGEVAGTYLYMSPEQIGGSSRKLDARTDVFSLGSTLYEALSLRRPFEGSSPAEVMQRVLRRDPAPLPREVPAELGLVCARAMEKSPGDRYPTMEALAEDLRRFLDERPLRARPAGPVGRARRLVQRNRAAAAVVLSLAVAAVAVLWSALDDGAPAAFAGWTEPTVPPVPEGKDPWLQEPLSVYASDPALAPLLAEAEWAVLLPEPTEADYVLRADDGRHAELSTKDGLRIWRATEPVGRAENARDVAFALDEAARREALWRGFYGLAHSRGTLPANASFVTLPEEETRRYGLDRARVVAPSRLAASSANLPPQFEAAGGVQDPTYAALEVENAASGEVYVTVFSVASDRSLNKIWPLGAEGEPVPPGGRALVPVGLVHPREWTFDFPMRDRYVTFVSRQPLEIRIDRNDLEVTRSVGVPVLPDPLNGALRASALGAGPEPAELPAEDWGVCAVDLLVSPFDEAEGASHDADGSDG